MAYHFKNNWKIAKGGKDRISFKIGHLVQENIKYNFKIII